MIWYDMKPAAVTSWAALYDWHTPWLCYTSCGALAGTQNSLMGPLWRINLTNYRTMSRCSTTEIHLRLENLDDQGHIRCAKKKEEKKDIYKHKWASYVLIVKERNDYLKTLILFYLWLCHIKPVINHHDNQRRPLLFHIFQAAMNILYIL